MAVPAPAYRLPVHRSPTHLAPSYLAPLRFGAESLGDWDGPGLVPSDGTPSEGRSSPVDIETLLVICADRGFVVSLGASIAVRLI